MREQDAGDPCGSAALELHQGRHFVPQEMREIGMTQYQSGLFALAARHLRRRPDMAHEIDRDGAIMAKRQREASPRRIIDAVDLVTTIGAGTYEPEIAGRRGKAPGEGLHRRKKRAVANALLPIARIADHEISAVEDCRLILAHAPRVKEAIEFRQEGRRSRREIYCLRAIQTFKFGLRLQQLGRERHGSPRAPRPLCAAVWRSCCELATTLNPGVSYTGAS